MREYDQIADWYAKQRGGSTGVPELRRLCAELGEGARVLDVGCGTGHPLTGVLVDAGCRVTGLDSSSKMLAHFRVNFPELETIHAPIESAALPEARFEAAVAWGVLFHLDHDAQATALATLARALVPGGRLLFTAGTEHGMHQGAPMNGVPFRYWSYATEGYRELLARHELELERVSEDVGGNTYYWSRHRAR